MAQTEKTDDATQPVAIPPAAFVEGGKAVDEIAVGINMGIIERFSEGLYATPTKAFEELVTNSYDAGAGRVWIVLPNEVGVESAIAVLDDGISMDIEGLRDLWQIGESTKRDRAPVEDRDPVGKFGIGKLSTYVLAQSLTYVCKRESMYLATTMDFSKVRGWFSDAGGVRLEVVELDASSARAALERVITNSPVIEALFSEEESPANWTAAIMTNLKERALTLHRPSLHWVMSSALPLNPQFRLWINKKAITSSKAKGKEIWKWKVGASDLVAKTAYADAATEDGITLPDGGFVTGTAELFALPLPRGISEGVGRSHGFFVTVRKRLVNTDENDPSFGIKEELKHGVLTRFHMEVNADGLDDGVTATRESVKESPALDQVRKYLLSVFNQARREWEAVDKGDAEALTTSDRIARPPTALSQGPLRRALAQIAQGEEDALLDELVSPPADGVAALPAIDSEDNMLQGIVLEERGAENRISSYDAERRVIVVNRNHPFIDNYMEAKAAREPLQLIAATELLTAFYLLDEDVPRDVIRDVLDRRDAYLRALVEIYPRSASVIAQKLREAVVDEKQLEDAVADAMDYLGYFVRRRSGSNKTDVAAWAFLGPRTKAGDSETYGVVCDAKSSSAKSVIKADKVNVGILNKHRKQEHADYIMVVAPGFEGAESESSSINEIGTEFKITPIAARDLARIVELYPTRVVNPHMLRTLFDVHTPKKSEEYVDKLVAEAPERPFPPIDLILEIIVERSKGRSPVSVDTLIGLISERTGGKIEYSIQEMGNVVDGLHALAPTTFWRNNRFVALQTTPEKVKEEIRENLADLPSGTAQAARKALGAD